MRIRPHSRPSRTNSPRIRRSRARPTSAGVVVVIAAAAGLLAATTQATPVAVSMPEAPGRPAALSWHPCPTDPEIQCATYPVPLDYAHPAAASISLAVYRRPATDSSHRIGTLFVNPGGPGDSAFKLTAKLMATFYPVLAARFDIVGMDPRGVGASSPIQCFATDTDRDDALSAAAAVPLTRIQMDATARADDAFTDGCAANAGPLLAHMSTLDVTRDLDTLRQAVGESRLTYFGQSYGTLLGATYANLYPDRVRAMVLDGMVDPAARTGDSLDYEMQRAAGFESVLDAFLSTCRQAGPRCAFSTGDPAAKFALIRDRVRRMPLPMADGSTMDPDRLWNWLTQALPNPANFPGTATILQQLYTAATAPTGPSATKPAITAITASTASTTPATASAAYSYNQADAFAAVNCLDEQISRTPERWPAIAAEFERAAPTFGRGQAYSALPCATWPVTTTDRYAGPWNRPTAHPLLIVANLHDAATPYPMAERATRELADARLLTIDGFGHTSAGESTCATNDVTAYLTDAALPPPGAVCQPDVQPFQG